MEDTLDTLQHYYREVFNEYLADDLDEVKEEGASIRSFCHADPQPDDDDDCDDDG